MKGHVVGRILPGSIAEELDIEKGDRLLGIRSMDENNSEEGSFMEIEDVFDYQYMIQDTAIEILIEKPDGEQWLLEVDKDPDEDLGIEFENGLMDEYRHCRNKCVFCFIDQMPPGMRETLYFKDDDSRLSFLQGNYVTLTNMSDYDIDRICKYRLSPINISFQTMNPELRCRMLNNQFAGEALKKVDTLYEAGIRMNGQIVLCKGLNDGRELEDSIEQLMRYIPNLESVSVVPVGLTKYREGLYPLEPFTKEDAVRVIDTIEKYQRVCFAQYGTHFIHASDEWYILADRELPEEQRYDGYLQLENGVGMLRLLMDEFEDAMKQRSSGLCNVMEASGDNGGVHETMGQHSDGDIVCNPMEQCSDRDNLCNPMEQCSDGDNLCNHMGQCSDGGNLCNPMEQCSDGDIVCNPMEQCSEGDSLCNYMEQCNSEGSELAIATGWLAYPYIQRMADRMMEEYPGLHIHVYPITNDFFGEKITVSGLITGQDLLKQLKNRPLGRCLLLPENILRSGEDVFLDDFRVGDLERALQVPLNIVKSSGYDFVDKILSCYFDSDKCVKKF